MEIETDLKEEENLEGRAVDSTANSPVCYYCGAKDKIITRYVVNACFDCLKEVTKDAR